MILPEVKEIRCAPKCYACPGCGQKGRRVRRLCRRVRTLAYKRLAYLDIHYGEYRARCGCRKTFRSWPLAVPAKADYDEAVRTAVLDHLLQDGLNVQRTLAAMKRDYLLRLSEGFVYDCLRWKVAQLELAPHRQLVLGRFSGTLCVDEVHLGRYTLLLATDPIADLVVAFALVGRNDSAHMRRFLKNLKDWGLKPKVVVTDGSSLYPGVLAELWPLARHQLCIFHILKDLNDLVLKGVRRLARALTRRGNAGRKRRRGRPSQAAQAARRRQGPTLRQKARYIQKHRFLLVKKADELGKEGWEVLTQLFAYEPQLRTLWQFACDCRRLFEAEARVQALWKRRAELLRREEYQRVPELVKAMKLLERGKFNKLVAFASSPTGRKVRTNNHVERANRKFRFAEKVRYKWRRRKWVLRFVLLALDRVWRQAAERPDQPLRPRPNPPPATPTHAA